MTKIVVSKRPPRYRFLGGWQDVLDDVRTLCQTLSQLPDACECGDGAAHLNGTCPCCGHVAVSRVPACDDCGELLARLRPSIDAMRVDTSRFFPFVKQFLSQQDAAAAQRACDIQAHIAALARSFDQLVLAAGAFRADCRASHLHTIKDGAAALRRDAESLNRLV